MIENFNDGSDAQEAANTTLCYETAIRNGHTAEEAQGCDDGDVGCPDCPWRPKMKNEERAATEAGE